MSSASAMKMKCDYHVQDSDGEDNVDWDAKSTDDDMMMSDSDSAMDDDDDDDDMEVLSHGKVVDSESEDEKDEPMDIRPAAPAQSKAAKTKAKAPKKPTVQSLSRTKLKAKPAAAVPPNNNSEDVDVVKFTRAKIFKAGTKTVNQQVGSILPQSKTCYKRIVLDKTKKASSAEQIQALIKSGTVTRDTCVKAVVFDTKGRNENDPAFVYHFGLWTNDGRLHPFNVNQMDALIKADFALKKEGAPKQTAKKWITDKKNMMDPDSFHVIKHDGRDFNVPMPITSTASYNSFKSERGRAATKQKKQTQAKLNRFASSSGSKAPVPQSSPQAIIAKAVARAEAEKKQEEAPTMFTFKSPARPAPKRKAESEPTGTDKDAPPQKKNKTIKEFVMEHAKPAGEKYEFVVDINNNQSFVCSLSAHKVWRCQD